MNIFALLFVFPTTNLSFIPQSPIEICLSLVLPVRIASRSISPSLLTVSLINPYSSDEIPPNVQETRSFHTIVSLDTCGSGSSCPLAQDLVSTIHSSGCFKCLTRPKNRTIWNPHDKTGGTKREFHSAVKDQSKNPKLR